jgi:hypothetical protein
VITTASGFIFQTFGHWAGFLTAALVAAAFAAKSLLDHLVGERRSGQFPLLVPLALNVRDGIRCRTTAFAHMKNPQCNLQNAANCRERVADCGGAGTETLYVKGLNSKADVDEWLAGTRRMAWLRSQGYAK